MEPLFEVGGRTLRVVPILRGSGFDLEIDGRPAEAALAPLAPGEFELRCDGGVERVFLAQEGDRVFVHLRGRALEVTVVDPLERARQQTRARLGAGEIFAPMPGVVVEVLAAIGDAVRPGDTLLVIESMKLQTAIPAEREGRVAALPVALGASFRRGDVLARIESAPAEALPA